MDFSRNFSVFIFYSDLCTAVGIPTPTISTAIRDESWRRHVSPFRSPLLQKVEVTTVVNGIPTRHTFKLRDHFLKSIVS